MHKIIFIDVDGVLNRICEGGISTPIKMVGDIMTMADPELVYRLNLIVDRTGAEMVLSSSWRHLKNWRATMKASGIVKSFLDRTDTQTKKHGGFSMEGGEYRRVRGNVIQAWLNEHPVERYAIIDDDDDMLASQFPNFFKTDPAFGLTQEIADRIEKHFTRQ